MNRSTFLKNLIGLYGIAALPLEMVRQYQKVYLLQSFVRGFRFYEGPDIIREINKSGLLELVREPDNKFDKNAIALHFNRQKIGFLPQESNAVLSILLDAELVKLQAEITHIEPDAADWEKLHVAVYALKGIDNPVDWQKIESHTMLETPRYHTLRSKDTYTRLYYEECEIMDGEDFYKALVEHSATNEVYDLIHCSFRNAEEIEAVVQQSKLVINKKRLPPDLSIAELEQTIGDACIQIAEVFAEDGYIVANVNSVATIPDKISSFERVLDRQGRYFYEVVFKSN